MRRSSVLLYTGVRPNHGKDVGLAADATHQMFKLITMVKRGSGSNFPAAWARYETLEDARSAAATLLRQERVGNVMIVRDGLGQEFVEWCSR